jgi:hypothetical protein
VSGISWTDETWNPDTIPVICVCGRRDRLTERACCRACGRDRSGRITALRLKVLTTLAVHPTIDLNPQLRKSLVALQLIVQTCAPRRPRPGTESSSPPRHALTTRAHILLREDLCVVITQMIGVYVDHLRHPVPDAREPDEAPAIRGHLAVCSGCRARVLEHTNEQTSDILIGSDKTVQTRRHHEATD